jgi:hypothetical protein
MLSAMNGKEQSGRPNPNDEIRQKMLEYFHDRARKARGKTGKFGIAATISVVKSDLKDLHGFTQPEVVANLRYLIDRGWVNETTEVKQVPTKGGMVVPSSTTYYEISAEGTDKIEGGSVFQPKPQFAGINVQASGSSVVTFGDGNVVNVEYQQLFTQLADLRDRIADSTELDDKQKFSTVVDIGTLQNQLAKEKPDKQVAKRLWGGIEKAANLAGLSQFAAEIAKAIGQAIG